jgi:hypothetical protein
VKELPELKDCKTKAEMIEQCDITCKAVLDFIDEVPEGYLRAKADPSGWTTEENLKHAATTLGIIASWVGAPTFILKLRGKPKIKTISLSKIPVTNRPTHYDYGSYPKPGKPAKHLKEKLKKLIVNKCEKWKAAVMKRTDEQLDSYSGFFSGVSLRLFAMFSLKHMLFHVGIARLRILNGTSPDYAGTNKQSAK